MTGKSGYFKGSDCLSDRLYRHSFLKNRHGYFSNPPILPICPVLNGRYRQPASRTLPADRDKHEQPCEDAIVAPYGAGWGKDRMVYRLIVTSRIMDDGSHENRFDDYGDPEFMKVDHGVAGRGTDTRLTVERVMGVKDRRNFLQLQTAQRTGNRSSRITRISGCTRPGRTHYVL